MRTILAWVAGVALVAVTPCQEEAATQQPAEQLLAAAEQALGAGRHDEAIEALQMSLRLSPLHAASAYGLARAFAAKGDRARALEWLERAAQWGFTGAERLRTDLRAALGGEPDYPRLRAQVFKNTFATERNARLRQALSRRETLQRLNRFCPPPGLAADGHHYFVNGATFSPDGERLVSWAGDGTVLLWQVAEGKLLASLGRHSLRGVAAEFNHDGERVLVTDTEAGIATLWNGRSGEVLGTIVEPRSVLASAAFTPDGRRIMTASAGGRVRFCDGSTGATLAKPAIDTVDLHWAQLAPDGTRVLTACRDGRARLWHAETGEYLGCAGDDEHPAETVKLERDGETVITVDDRRLVRWRRIDQPTPEKAVIELPPFTGWGTSLQLERAWVHGADGSVQLWDLATGKRMPDLLPAGSPVQHFQRNRDETRLLAWSDRSRRAIATLWDLRTGAKLQDFTDTWSPICYAAFTPDDSRIVTTMLSGNAGEPVCTIWDPQTGQPLGSRRSRDIDTAFFVAVSPDSRTIAVGGWDGDVHLYDAASGEPGPRLARARPRLQAIRFGPRGQHALIDGQVSSLHPEWALQGEDRHESHGSFSPDEQRVATTSNHDPEIVAIRDLRGVLVQVLSGNAPVHELEFNRDGRRVVTTGENSTIALWDVETGVSLAEFPTIEPGRFGETRLAAFSPDGGVVATVGAQHTVELRDAEHGDALGVLAGHTGAVSRILFSPAGDLLASIGGDDTVRVWELQKPSTRQVLQHESRIRAAAFTPGGKRLATVGDDGTGHLWNLDTGKTLGTLTGHTERIVEVEFSDDGGQVLTASDDGTARLWDAHTGRALLVLEGHFGAVRQALFCPDGERIVTLSWHDGTLRFWDRVTGELLGTHTDLSAWRTSTATATASDDNERWLRQTEVWRAASRKEVETRRRTAEQSDAVARLTPIIWQDGHGGIIDGVRFSPDGDTLLTWAEDGLFQVWDTRTGGNIGTLGRHSGQASADFNADGSRIGMFDAGTARMTLWDGRSLERLASLGDDASYLTRAEFNPAGDRCVTVDDRGAVRFWNTENGGLLASPTIATPGTTDLRFSPDGKTLLTDCLDGSARLWDAASGAALAVLGSADEPMSAWFTLNGNRLITWSGTSTHGRLAIWSLRGEPERLFEQRAVTEGDQPGLVSPDGKRTLTQVFESGQIVFVLWDVDRRAQVARLEEHATEYNHAGFSPDGARIATWSEGRLCFWDGTTGARIAAHEVEGCRRLLFDPTGRYLIAQTSSAGAHLQSFDATTGASLHTAEHLGTIFDITFSADAQRIAAVGWPAYGTVHDSALSQHLLHIDGHARRVPSVAIHPAGEEVVSVSEADPRSAANHRGAIRVWNLQSGLDLDRRSLASTDRSFQCADFRADGRQLLIGSTDALLLRIVDCETGALITELDPNPRRGGLLGALFSPDGERVLGTAHGAAKLWDAANGTLVFEFRTYLYRRGSTHSPHAVFSPDGSLIASAAHVVSGAPRRVEIRDGRSGALLRRFDAHDWTGEIMHLTFSSSGRYLATSGSPTNVWDTATWQRLHTFAHPGLIWHAAFSPDEKQIVTAGIDGTARTHTIEGSGAGRILRGHSGPIRFVAYSPAGDRIVTTSDDGTARFWNPATGGPVRTLVGHTAPVLRAQFTPDRTLITTGADSTVRIWDHEAGTLLLTKVIYDDDNWLAFDPNGYYDATRQAAEWARISVDGRTFPLSSFAKVFHAPDKVAAAVAGQPAARPSFLPRPPEVSDLEPESGTIHDRAFTLDVAVEDSYGIDCIAVEQDGQPIAGSPFAKDKLELRSRGRLKRARLTLPLQIPADRTATQVTVRATNVNGILSWPKSVQMHYEPLSRDLHVFAIGVADYDDDKMDLKYPENDVDGIIAAFEAQEGVLFDKVHTTRLIDDEVTAGKLKGQRYAFLEARPEDTIVVFAAGHGIRTDKDEYFFLTRECTPDKPFDGIERDVLEKLVTWDQLHARQRILLIDTCHSGGGAEATRGDLRGRPLFEREEADAAMSKSGGGVYIISAGADDEFAREQDGNGLFTRALLDGLAGEADRSKFGDHNGWVEIEELKQFAADRVQEKSGGRQRPAFPLVKGGENFKIAKVRR